MSNKLSLRAISLDAGKPMPIYMAEELPDLPDYSVINRAVPQMPSGMEKEEECEHHLQRAICAGLIIPTPEVSEVAEEEIHDKLYPANYKHPRQLIHMQPFTMEQDIPDYDMDSEDERWLDQQAKKLDLTPLKFEEMMDRLEKSSGQTVVSLQEAKALLKEDDDLIIAVFDYWLNKRLKLQHPLILAVKKEHRAGTAVNNPYIAFRRRTDQKMQTRKHRKNDETSYEKMLKLRRDLSRAVTLLDFIKRREKMKRELVHLTVEVFEKRYQAKDFAGDVAAEVLAHKAPRPAFTPIFHNNYANHAWNNKAIRDENVQRKDKRQYKRRKHKSLSHHHHRGGGGMVDAAGGASSDEEPAPIASPEPEEPEDEGLFAFRRNKNCNYHMPLQREGNWSWCPQEENGLGDKRYRYCLTSLSNPRRCIGFARRRMGRGGRVILDRLSEDVNDFWRSMDYTVYESTKNTNNNNQKTTFPSVDNNNSLRTDIKMETTTTTVTQEAAVRTNSVYYSDAVSASGGVGEQLLLKDVQPAAAREQFDFMSSSSTKPAAVPTTAETKHPSSEERDEMLEMLQSVQRDWLHFRPKTPPPDYSPPCHLLSPTADEAMMLMPCANAPFALELQALDDTDSIFTESTYLSAPLVLDYDLAPPPTDPVPVTDTRQQSSATRNQQLGLRPDSRPTNKNNTLTLKPLEDNDYYDDNGGGLNVIGCSRFSLRDDASSTSNSRQQSQHCSTSTLTSLKLNHVNVMPEVRPKAQQQHLSQTVAPTTTTTLTGTTFDSHINANGIVPQFAIEGANLTRNNKKCQPYQQYIRAMGNNTMGTGNSNLSLHTSAHTVTLNSHSANILEIPISNDTDPVTTKNQRDSAGSTSPNNSKTKTIVRKNLVMEVT